MVRRRSSAGRSSSRSLTAHPVPVHGRLGHGSGSVSGRRPAVELVVSGLLQLFNQPPGVVSGALRCPWFSSSSSGSAGCSLRRQYHGVGLPQEARRHPIPDPQLGCSIHPPLVRGPSHSAASPVHPGQAECAGGFFEPQVASPRLRVDSLLRSFPPASSSLASDARSLRDVSEPPSTSILFTHGGSTVSGHGCYAPVMG